MGLQGGGYRVCLPVSKGLLDHDRRHGEANHDSGQPEDSREMFRGGDVDKTMNGRRLEEFLDLLHHSILSLSGFESETLDIKTQTK